jgi:hypothetical protein
MKNRQGCACWKQRRGGYVGSISSSLLRIPVGLTGHGGHRTTHGHSNNENAKASIQCDHQLSVKPWVFQHKLISRCRRNTSVRWLRSLAAAKVMSMAVTQISSKPALTSVRQASTTSSIAGIVAQNDSSNGAWKWANRVPVICSTAHRSIGQ